jgi:hypothetical protein
MPSRILQEDSGLILTESGDSVINETELLFANSITTGIPQVGNALIDGSTRRVVSIGSSTENLVTISELYNRASITDHNYANYNSEYNRVA